MLLEPQTKNVGSFNISHNISEFWNFDNKTQNSQMCLDLEDIKWEANTVAVYIFKSRVGNFASVCEGVACIREILLKEVNVKSG